MAGFEIFGIRIAKLQGLGLDGVGFALRNDVRCDQPRQNFIALADGAFEISPRAAGVWSSYDSHEEGALPFCELRGGSTEVIERSFFDSVEAGSKVDSIEIGRKDFRFGEFGFDAVSEGDLEEFPVE